MKKLLLVLTVVAMASFLLVGCFGTTPPPDEVVTIAAISGVTAPVTGATPVTAITATAQYTGVVTWLPDDVTFAAETVYTATITLTAKAGFTLTGVPADFFTVATATATNLVDSGVVAAVFPATGAAPVVVGPTITAIDDQEVAWDGAPWTYQVAWTVGTGTITAFSLAGEPATMTISAAGLITWTNIAPAPAVYAVTVTMVTTDGSDTEAFVITVEEPVVLPFVSSIVYDPLKYYYDGTYKYVRSGAVTVTVTLLEALVPGDSLAIQWNDGTAVGGWEVLTLKTGTTLVYEGTVTFDAQALTPLCKLVCVEVAKQTDCCPDELFTDIVKVDSVDPYLDLNIVFVDCADACDPGFKFIFKPNTYGTCSCLPCCGDACSDIAGWSIVDAAACPECEPLTGTTCVTGTYGCGCLLFADVLNWDSSKNLTYKLDFTFTDNVGNALVDEWTIVLDTDSVVTFTNTNLDASPIVVSAVTNLVWNIQYNDCDDLD